MRYAIIADIHGNLAAFEAVLEDIRQKGGVEEFWCLGDIVGYGPEPGACIEKLRRLKAHAVAGNHDLGAAGKAETKNFNPDAAAAIRWTAGQLSPEEIAYLEGLPVRLEHRGFTLVHGSPMEPTWEYVLSTGIAGRNFDYFSTDFCLTGHTHIPAVFRQEDGGCRSYAFSPGVGLMLSGGRMLINPGGVGQPRDGDPRAAYAVYDTEAGMLRLYRVPYDISATQEKMVKVNLPMHLVTRLQQGR